MENSQCLFFYCRLFFFTSLLLFFTHKHMILFVWRKGCQHAWCKLNTRGQCKCVDSCSRYILIYFLQFFTCSTTTLQLVGKCLAQGQLDSIFLKEQTQNFPKHTSPVGLVFTYDNNSLDMLSCCVLTVKIIHYANIYITGMIIASTILILCILLLL